MMAVDHYMRWNISGYYKLEADNWEEAERMSSPRINNHCPHKIFTHRPTQWLQMRLNERGVWIGMEINPVDPRMSAEERSWCIWDGNESTRRYWDLEIRRGHGPHHKIRTPEEIKERHRNGL